VPDAESVLAVRRYGEASWTRLAFHRPCISGRLIGLAVGFEAAMAFTCHGAKPKPAIRSDAGRWGGQGTVLVYLGPEVIEDVGLGWVVLHPIIMAGEVAATDVRQSSQS
jgi:hypothetical protein